MQVANDAGLLTIFISIRELKKQREMTAALVVDLTEIDSTAPDILYGVTAAH